MILNHGIFYDVVCETMSHMIHDLAGQLCILNCLAVVGEKSNTKEKEEEEAYRGEVVDDDDNEGFLSKMKRKIFG